MKPQQEHRLAHAMVSYTQTVREFITSSNEHTVNEFTMNLWDNAYHYGTHNFVRLVDKFSGAGCTETMFTPESADEMLAYFVCKATSLSPQRYVETFGAAMPPMAVVAFMCEMTLAVNEDLEFFTRNFQRTSLDDSVVKDKLNKLKKRELPSNDVISENSSYSQYMREIQEYARKIKKCVTSMYGNPVMRDDFRTVDCNVGDVAECGMVKASRAYSETFEDAASITSNAGIIAVLFQDADNSIAVVNHAIASTVWLMCRNGVEFLTERVVSLLSSHGLIDDERGIFRHLHYNKNRLIDNTTQRQKFNSESFERTCTSTCGETVDFSTWDAVEGLAQRFDFTAFNLMSTASTVTTQYSLTELLEFVTSFFSTCEPSLLHEVEVITTAVYCNMVMNTKTSQHHTSNDFWNPRRNDGSSVSPLKSLDGRVYELRAANKSYDRLKFIGGSSVALSHIKEKTESNPRGFALANCDYVTHVCSGSFKTSQGYGPVSSRLVSYSVGARASVVLPLTKSDATRRRDYAATFGPLCSVVGSLAMLLDNEAFDALEAMDRAAVEKWAHSIADTGILTVYSVIPATTIVEQRYYFAYLLTLLDGSMAQVMDFIAGIASVDKYLPTPGVTYLSLLYTWRKEDYDDQIALLANSPLSVVRDILGNHKFIIQDYSAAQSKLEIYSRDIVVGNFCNEFSMLSISAPLDKSFVSAVALRASRYQDGEWNVLECGTDMESIRDDNDTVFFEPLALEDTSIARPRRLSMNKKANHSVFDMTLL